VVQVDVEPGNLVNLHRPDMAFIGWMDWRPAHNVFFPVAGLPIRGGCMMIRPPKAHRVWHFPSAFDSCLSATIAFQQEA
jgi:hypothetical protein